jgi:putative GTP pyrophosphokinase
MKGVKFKIKIRSILQHAWAEIEHDLGYKSKLAVPESFIRNFNGMAALLELADIEFDRQKKDLSKYESEISHEIIVNPESVTINQTSVESLVKSSESINERENVKKPLRLRRKGFVNRIGQMSNHFIEDLKLLCALS